MFLMRGEYQLTVLFEQAVHDWGQHLIAGGSSADTVRLRTKTVRRFAHELGVSTPHEISGEQLVALAASYPWSNDYRRSVRTSLTMFFDYLKIDPNPAQHLPKVPESPPKPRPVPDDIWERALAHADSRETLMILLAGWAGLRRGEICRLKRTDLTGGPGAWTITVRGKGNKQRSIPIKDALADAIINHPWTGGYLFPGNDNGHLSPNRTGVLLSKLLGPGWTGHKLRHRYASRGYAATRDMMAVQQALGHSSPAVTQRYVHVPSDAVRAVSDAA